MKTLFIFLTLFLSVATFANAQSKYKRVYTLKNNHFLHTATFATGNAVIYVDRDSLIENLNNKIKYSDNHEFIKGRIKSEVNTIILLSLKSDTTNVSSIIKDPEITDITLSYFSECALNRKANIVDQRTNKLVTKIIVKKPSHSSRSVHTYSYYYYFLPNDRKEFMHRIEKIGSGVKFL